MGIMEQLFYINQGKHLVAKLAVCDSEYVIVLNQ